MTTEISDYTSPQENSGGNSQGDDGACKALALSGTVGSIPTPPTDFEDFNGFAWTPDDWDGTVSEEGMKKIQEMIADRTRKPSQALINLMRMTKLL